MALFGRRRPAPSVAVPAKLGADQRDGDHKPSPTGLRIFIALCYLISVVFLILVEIGNINGQSVIRDTYFLNINVANIVPATVPNAQLVNSLAQSIGLHDFYQVGLWGYCEGYDSEGVTYCSLPQTLYWFNPVAIIQGELLAGSSIAIPQQILDVLGIVRTASRWMFALFLVGSILSFLCIFFAPIAFSQQPRWNHRGRRIFCRNLPITVLTLGAFLFTAAASVVATVMFVIFCQVINNDASDLNLVPTLGTRMLAFEWIAVGFNLLGLLFQLGTCCGICCCTGRKKAVRKSQEVGSGPEKARGDAVRRFHFRRTAR